MKELNKVEMKDVSGGIAVSMVVFSAAVIGLSIIHKYTK